MRRCSHLVNHLKNATEMGKKVPPLGLYMGDQKLHKHSIVRKEWMHFPLIIRVCSHGTEMLRIVHGRK